MSAPSNRQILETKYDSCATAQRILNTRYSRFIFFQTSTKRNFKARKTYCKPKNGIGTVRFQRKIPTAAITEVAQAASMSVHLDIRLSWFCTVHHRMLHFAKNHLLNWLNGTRERKNGSEVLSTK